MKQTSSTISEKRRLKNLVYPINFFNADSQVPTTGGSQTQTALTLGVHITCPGLTEYIKRARPPPLLLPPSVTETCVSVCLLMGVFILSPSQADGVGASCRVVNGRTGGLGHSPFIPHFLPVVAAPESHCDIIVPGYGDGLLSEGRRKKISPCEDKDAYF